MDPPPNKAHRAAAAGPKAARKRARHSSNAAAAAARNPRAFAPRSGRSASRNMRRTLDNDQKKLHVPLVDRSPQVLPPIVVAVVGPPKTGKSTLIRSLVKRYSRHSLAHVHGPVTVVSGKSRRITFIECNNDLNAMIDIAKVADLVLLLIDASFGFEMETFEFLNVLQVHGFPRVMGVLTHLDRFKDNKRLRKVKKSLKQRFWTEIYQGAKLFYLSGISASGRYPKTEILNLSRFISVLKFRPLIWRNTHPYLIADRIEDISDPETIRSNPKADRSVAFFGYLRGSNLKNGSRVHIPGVGDHSLLSITALPDPCPFPDKSRRSLSDKHKLIHAPMSDVGGILYDRDAVYINLPASIARARAAAAGADPNADPASFLDPESLDAGEQMVLDLQNAPATIADNVRASQLRIFNSSKLLSASDPQSLDAILHPNGSTHSPSDDDDDEDDDEVDFDELEDEDDDDDEDEDVDDDEDDEDDDGIMQPDEFGRHRRRVARNFGRFKKNDGGNDDQNDNKAQERIPYADSDSDLDLSEEEEDDGEHQDGEDSDDEQNVPQDDDEDVDDMVVDGFLHWKQDMASKAASNFQKVRRLNLADYIYNPDLCKGSDTTASASAAPQRNSFHDMRNDDGEQDGLFEVRSRPDGSQRMTLRDFDTSKVEVAASVLDIWADEQVLESLRCRFVTGKDLPDGTQCDDGEDAGGDGDDDEDEVYGDFEDLENPGNSTAKDGTSTVNSAETGAQGTTNSIAQERDANARRKEQLKKKFDAEYDGEGDEEDEANFYEATKQQMAQQMEINRAEFEDQDPETRAQIEGYRAGTYVRIVIEGLPCEFIERFDPDYPILIGGLLPTEQTYGFVQVRIKKHRWYKRILKTNDPLIFSLGWRRFQTMPLLSINSDATRNRMLKYTPEHMHCLATFYGPVTAQNTGFCCFQSVSDVTADFRIAATGVVLDIDRTSEVVKKLKLTGTPLKIFKNTAFIKDMFNSSLEVAKFEGASIRTVSGIRGQIKRAVSKPEGAFRAAFEDKILMSDIVFLRAWYPVKPKKFYNPVSSLLLSNKSAWRGMRTTGQIRREENIRLVQQEDSFYRPIERKTRRFNKLRIPKKLQADLPFASKPKMLSQQRRPTLAQRRAVVMEPHERKIASLIQAINTIKNEKQQKRTDRTKERRQERIKKLSKTMEMDKKMQGERAREFYRDMGKKRAREAAAAASSSGGGRSKKKRAASDE